MDKIKINRFYIALVIVFGALAILIALIARVMFSVWQSTLGVEVEENTTTVSLDVDSLRQVQESFGTRNIEPLDLRE